MNAKGWKKSYKSLANPGSGGKGWNFMDSTVFFIQSFSVEIRPKKQFVHSRIDGAVD
jgi:hypothetical protein